MKLYIVVTDEDGAVFETWTVEAEEQLSDVQTARRAIQVLGEEIRDGVI